MEEEKTHTHTGTMLSKHTTQHSPLLTLSRHFHFYGLPPSALGLLGHPVNEEWRAATLAPVSSHLRAYITGPLSDPLQRCHPGRYSRGAENKAGDAAEGEGCGRERGGNQAAEGAGGEPVVLSKAHTEPPVQGFPLRTGLTPTTHRRDRRDSHTDIHSQSNLTHLPAWVDTDVWHSYPHTTTLSHSHTHPARPGRRAEHSS